MNANDTALLAVKGKIQDQDYVHTLHFRVTNVATKTTQQLIDAWQASCETSWLGAHNSAYSLREITASHICGTVPLQAPAIEQKSSPFPVGTDAFSASADLPEFLSLMVRERTALAGKTRQGRFFISGFREGDLDNNTIVSGRTASITAYLNDLADFMGSGSQVNDFILVVHSPTLAQPGVQCQNCSTPVTALQLITDVTTMRSRKRGHGH